MSIGKSSLQRLNLAAEGKESGIRSLAPEVPTGDAATPFAAVTEELTAAPQPTAPTPTAPVATDAAPKKRGRKPKAAVPTAADAAPKKRGRKPKSESTAEAPKKTAAPKKAPVKKAAAPKKTTVKAVKDKDGFVTVAVGEALPYWLL